MGCKSTEKKTVPPSTSDYRIDGEIIVQLTAKDELEKVLRDFSDYNLESLKTIAPYPPLFLLGYDSNVISASEMLEKLKSHPSVKEAEHNKKGGVRE